MSAVAALSRTMASLAAPALRGAQPLTRAQFARTAPAFKAANVCKVPRASFHAAQQVLASYGKDVKARGADSRKWCDVPSHNIGSDTDFVFGSRTSDTVAAKPQTC